MHLHNLFRRSHGHDHSVAAQSGHNANLAAVSEAVASEIGDTLRKAFSHVRAKTTEGRACQQEILRMMSAAECMPAVDRPKPTLAQARELLDRARFDIRCNPDAVTSLAISARELSQQYEQCRSHIPADVGRKVDILRVELDRLARRAAGSGVKAHTLSRLHQALERQRVVIEAIERRVKNWSFTARDFNAPDPTIHAARHAPAYYE